MSIILQNKCCYFFVSLSYQKYINMTGTIDISITRTERSKLKDLDLEHLPFGKYFTDHMLEADFEGGEWKNESFQAGKELVCGLQHRW